MKASGRCCTTIIGICTRDRVYGPDLARSAGLAVGEQFYGPMQYAYETRAFLGGIGPLRVLIAGPVCRTRGNKRLLDLEQNSISRACMYGYCWRGARTMPGESTLLRLLARAANLGPLWPSILGAIFWEALPGKRRPR